MKRVRRSGLFGLGLLLLLLLVVGLAVVFQVRPMVSMVRFDCCCCCGCWLTGKLVGAERGRWADARRAFSKLGPTGSVGER